MCEYLSIIGTDTDVGKTLIMAGLARAALNSGKRVLLLKPVQTGVTDGPISQMADAAVYRRFAPEADAVTLTLFSDPCSPHLAARRDNRAAPNAAALALAVKDEARRVLADIVFIEGAGGLLTPLNEHETLADLFCLLGAPLLLVVGNKLGAVNHALLSIESVKNRGLVLRGIVMNVTSSAASELEACIHTDNASIISKLGSVPCLAQVPYMPKPEASADCLAKTLAPILDYTPDNAQGQAPEVPEDLLAFDRAHLWHPYTSALHPLCAREAASTHGVRIRLRDGRELIDGMASWWCAIHGYRPPALVAALSDQAGRMPHVMFGGLTHQPAVRLASRLIEFAPQGLEHVFFCDSGSVAVEVAAKMAIQYQHAVGNPQRRRLLALRGAYHGDTIGAMSLCDPKTGMHHLFTGFLPRQFFAPRPECRFDAPYDPASAQALEALLAEHGSEIAALIVEPIVQGAGGMWMYHPEYLIRARELCDAHGCLLIADEIATGFGRTGRYFACGHADVTPDIMCVGKALTGGIMSLAATLASRRVAHGISRQGGVFMHGPTFMANPLACAVASASLDLLATGQWKVDVARIEKGLRKGLEPCRDMAGVADVRVLGAIGVVEMDAPVDVERLQNYFVNEHGVWIRPFGRLIYVMPPYTCNDQEIEVLTLAMQGAAAMT